MGFCGGFAGSFAWAWSLLLAGADAWDWAQVSIGPPMEVIAIVLIRRIIIPILRFRATVAIHRLLNH